MVAMTTPTGKLHQHIEHHREVCPPAAVTAAAYGYTGAADSYTLHMAADGTGSCITAEQQQHRPLDRRQAVRLQDIDAVPDEAATEAVDAGAFLLDVQP